VCRIQHFFNVIPGRVFADPESRSPVNTSGFRVRAAGRAPRNDGFEAGNAAKGAILGLRFGRIRLFEASNIEMQHVWHSVIEDALQGHLLSLHIRFR
jgi:hypothetical protein